MDADGDHVVPPLTGSAMAGLGATYTDVHYVLLVSTSLGKGLEKDCSGLFASRGLLELVASLHLPSLSCFSSGSVLKYLTLQTGSVFFIYQIQELHFSPKTLDITRSLTHVDVGYVWPEWLGISKNPAM
jgi:hypothetical protein